MIMIIIIKDNITPPWRCDSHTGSTDANDNGWHEYLEL